MLRNYIKASLRKFRRSKAHTLINLAGLTLGLLFALIIFQKVRFELSYDAYHPDADRIYRVVREDRQFGQAEYDEGVPYPFANALRTDFPEIEHVVIVDRNFGAPVLTVHRSNGEPFRAKENAGSAFVDQDFFSLFQYEWLYGNPETALAAPQSVVLSETMAHKYFGTDNPMGQTISFDGEFDLTVAGIVRDAPHNTALPLSIMISNNLGEAHRRGNQSWGSTSTAVQCYLKLPASVEQASIEERLGDFLAKHRSPEVAQYLRFFLQPLSEIQRDTRFETIGNQRPLVSRETLWGLSLIGLFLLITAGINFINMNIVLVIRRAREVAVRKVMGGSPRQIMMYFLTETALSTAIALIVALALVNEVIRMLSPFIGEGFSANPFTDPIFAGAAVAATLVLSLIAGLYPAFLMGRLSPTVAMRNAVGKKQGSMLLLRRGLVVFQFAISQVLIICTLVTMQQMRYVNTAPLGYEPDAIVEFDLPDQDKTNLRTFKNELLQSTAIQNVSFSNTGASSGNIWGSNFYYYKDENRHENEAENKFVDLDYIDTYRMTLLAGENFTPTDSVSGFIVNQAMVEVMGFASPEEALGTTIELRGGQLSAPVVGVVRNFNTNSLHQQVEATILIPGLDAAYLGAAKVNATQLSEGVATIRRAWSQAFPEDVFEYEFLDDRISQFYEDERALQYLIQTFAIIAIVIGCIGLFGLISYTASQRSKEVGIRKVLGASIGNIVGMLTREFVAFVIVGFLISAPVAYYVMSNWLENFAYRIDLGFGLFAVALVVSLVIAIGTVGAKTLRAATSNPVDAIRMD